jgi:serine/threonine protein phosphatase PrpC
MVLKSIKSIQGKRDYMEDRYNYLERNGLIIAFVCDGHGGHTVAEITSKNLGPVLYNTVSKFPTHLVMS